MASRHKNDNKTLVPNYVLIDGLFNNIYKDTIFY